MKFLIVGMVALTLCGCSLLAPKVGPEVAKAVNRYCAEPYQVRLLMRTEVNTLISPNTIKVTCEGDPE